MTEAIDDLARRVAVLEDIAAIRALKARYLRAADLKLIDDIRDCFDPMGAVIAYEDFPVLDRDGFVAAFRDLACRPGVFDMHHGSNAEIALTGPHSATGKWSLYFQSIILEQRTVLQFGCEYEDEYTRRDGSWYISRTATRKTSICIETIAADGTPHVTMLGRNGAVLG